jgi:hypothetical protein
MVLKFPLLCDFQMELASYSERFSGLRQERETLVMQLHHAVERANVASCRAEVIMTSYLMLLSIIEINNLRINIYTNIICEQYNSLHRLCMQGPLQQPVVGRHVYNIRSSIDNAIRAMCYGLYSSCSCPMRIRYINEV